MNTTHLEVEFALHTTGRFFHQNKAMHL